MPSTLVKEVVLDRVGSHSVSTGVNYHNEIEKEECFGYFSATWRGEHVRLTVSADRYRHSSGMSEWRIYCRDAKVVDPADERNGTWYYHGPSVSDTARQRLGEVAKPIMAAWLDSADYAASRRVAFVHMLKREAQQLSDYSVDHFLTLVDKYVDEISVEDTERLKDVAAAYRIYAAALGAVET